MGRGERYQGQWKGSDRMRRDQGEERERVWRWGKEQEKVQEGIRVRIEGGGKLG